MINIESEFVDDFHRAIAAMDQQQQTEQRAAQRLLEAETNATLNRRPFLPPVRRQAATGSRDEQTERNRQATDRTFDLAMQHEPATPRAKTLTMF